MKIWILGEQQDKRELWGDLLTNSLPSATVNINYDSDNFLKENFTIEDIVVCLTVNFTSHIQSFIDQSIAANIPILCVVDDVNDITYDYLIQKGINGLLNQSNASLDTIKKAIRIVQNGGYYIESPNRKNRNKETHSSKHGLSEHTPPAFDMDEWKVFSLTSKGFTVDEIARQLNISIVDTSNHLNEIMLKTKTKTISGAVADGIHNGWLLRNK